MEGSSAILLLILGLLLVFIASGMWISTALGLVGVTLIAIWLGIGQLSMIGPVVFNTLNNFAWPPIPLFIFMGNMIAHSGISNRLYKDVTPLVSWLPGGLLHSNILTSAFFAAVSGESLAASATIGSIAIPQQEGRYDRKLIYGSLACGGTLGILIPPSIMMIYCAAFTGESVGKTFLAGVIPGLTLSGLFMGYIAVVSTIKPGVADLRPEPSLKAMALSIFGLWPILLMIFMVLGTIYLGLATPTEAAGMAAFMSIVICAYYRRLNWQVLKEAGLAAVKVSSFLSVVVVGATLVGMGLSFLKVTARLVEMVASLGLSPMAVLVIIILFYVILGMFMEGASMIILTLPLTYPLMTKLGFDGMWFIILLVVLVEMALVTPPVGMNLFVLHHITEGKYYGDIVKGIIPFLICMVIMIVTLVLFPEIALWLPKRMF